MKLENLILTPDQKAAIRELVALEDTSMTLKELNEKLEALGKRISPDEPTFDYTEEDYGDGEDLIYANDQIECNGAYTDSFGHKRWIDCEPIWEVFFNYAYDNENWELRDDSFIITVHTVDIWIPSEFMD